MFRLFNQIPTGFVSEEGSATLNTALRELQKWSCLTISGAGITGHVEEGSGNYVLVLEVEQPFPALITGSGTDGSGKTWYSWEQLDYDTGGGHVQTVNGLVGTIGGSAQYPAYEASYNSGVPTGALGTGAIVEMHQGFLNTTAAGREFWFVYEGTGSVLTLRDTYDPSTSGEIVTPLVDCIVDNSLELYNPVLYGSVSGGSPTVVALAGINQTGPPIIFNGSPTQENFYGVGPESAYLFGLGWLTDPAMIGAAVTGSTVPGGTTLVSVQTTGGGSFTGTSHTSTLIDSIASTTGVYGGMSITGSGVPDGTVIVSVLTNSITISQPTTSSTTATFTFAGGSGNQHVVSMTLSQSCTAGSSTFNVALPAGYSFVAGTCYDVNIAFTSPISVSKSTISGGPRPGVAPRIIVYSFVISFDQTAPLTLSGIISFTNTTGPTFNYPPTLSKGVIFNDVTPISISPGQLYLPTGGGPFKYLDPLTSTTATIPTDTQPGSFAQNGLTNYTGTTSTGGGTYTPVFDKTNAAGLHGCTTIINTHAMFTLGWKATATDFFGNTGTLTGTAGAGVSVQFDFDYPATFSGTFTGPVYVPLKEFKLEVEDGSSPNHATYNCYLSLVG